MGQEACAPAVANLASETVCVAHLNRLVTGSTTEQTWCAEHAHRGLGKGRVKRVSVVGACPAQLTLDETDVFGDPLFHRGNCTLETSTGPR